MIMIEVGRQALPLFFLLQYDRCDYFLPEITL